MDRQYEKRKEQLGMPYPTARQRLMKMILFDFATKAGCRCFRCGNEMSLEDFSVEHKQEWQNKANALGLFFDLGNIAFSHMTCNGRAASLARKIYPNTAASQAARNQRRKERGRQQEMAQKREKRRAARAVTPGPAGRPAARDARPGGIEGR